MSIQQAEYLIGHSVAQDVAKLAQISPVKKEWITGEKLLDSLLLARMVDENKETKGAYELENLLASIHHVESWKTDTRKIGNDAALWPSDLRIERCRRDAWASFLIADHYYRQLQHCRPLVTFTHKIASVLERLRLAGCFIDYPHYKEWTAGLEAEVAVQRDLLRRAAAVEGMEEFNPTNDGHIRELLFTRLGLPVVERTAKTGAPAVTATVLRNIKHPVAELLLKYNKVDKLFDVNGEGLKEKIRVLGRVAGDLVGWLPARINPLGTRTGRRSSSKPNMQNWPKIARAMVRSRYPEGKIGDFDYRRLEVVLIAWVAGDEKLYFEFTEGDGYVGVAKDLWGFDVTDGTPEYKATKVVILGVNYNLQDAHMAKNLWNLPGGGVRFSTDYRQHVRETSRVRRKYLSQHPALGAYMERQISEYENTGQVVSLPGRIRHLGEVPDTSSPEGFRQLIHAQNQAINFPIQSLASEVTGSALLDVEAEFLRYFNWTYEQYFQYLLDLEKKYLTSDPDSSIIHTENIPLLINEVHDDLVVDIPSGQEKLVQDIMIETMSAVPTLRKLCPAFDIPLRVSADISTRWGKYD